MDNVNRFHTDETWLFVRAEHVALVLVLSTIVALHAREMDWGRFFAAFVAIDLVGYIPGAIASRRALPLSGAIDRLRKTLIVAKREGSAAPRFEPTGQARQCNAAAAQPAPGSR
jgi:hypothetical protein